MKAKLEKEKKNQEKIMKAKLELERKQMQE